MDNNKDTIQHYDLLIDENNDPFHDPEALQNYMNKWDGTAFIDALNLSHTQNVLEIGIGTGRLARKTAVLCKTLYGIDISPKTAERAMQNLSYLNNIHIICGDFLSHNFDIKFETIYSSLTFMHIKEKEYAFTKVASLLKPDGIFVLSIDKNQNKYINTGTRKIRIYPDSPHETASLAAISGLSVINNLETEFAHIFVMSKNSSQLLSFTKSF